MSSSKASHKKSMVVDELTAEGSQLPESTNNNAIPHLPIHNSPTISPCSRLTGSNFSTKDPPGSEVDVAIPTREPNSSKSTHMWSTHEPAAENMQSTLPTLESAQTIWSAELTSENTPTQIMLRLETDTAISGSESNNHHPVQESSTNESGVEKINHPENSYDDTLTLSLSRLKIDAPLANSKSESPKTPFLTRFPSKAVVSQSPGAKSNNSRSSQSSASSAPRVPSLDTLHATTPSPIHRSSSTQFLNASTLVGKPRVIPENKTPETSPCTAESLARTFFKAELETHEKLGQACRNVDTIVILHDSCYGHRYSRPRTSKVALSNIVERPERIHASILGISLAYVRLGERHSGGRYAQHLQERPIVTPKIPFRISKTTRRESLSSVTVTNVHGKNWMNELKIMCEDAETRLAIYGKELVRPDIQRSPDQEAPATLHEGDLYLCSESLNAIEGALGAVCEAVDAVFHQATVLKGPCRAFVAIRPPGHHCSAGHPSGFCWVNNIHVGISHASLAHGLTHAAIIDFDLHHGDGSQAIAWENNRRAASAAKNALLWKKTSIGYFSLHDINSYPCEMGDEEKIKNASLCIENAHGQSIWNVHLQPWKTEAEFWNLYETKYSVLLEKARSYLHAQTERIRWNTNGVKPKGAIFLSAGFDASEWESSGMQRHKVNVPTEFYARFTRDVVRLANEEGTGVDGRIVSILEGGYSDRAISTGVFSHLCGMTVGDSNFINYEPSCNNFASDICQETSNMNKTSPNQKIDTLETLDYDPVWWSFPHLEELDAVQHPPKIPEPKKKRDSTKTFSSPTQSFISKVNTTLSRRTTLGKTQTFTQLPRPESKVSSPPPEVNWAVASLELTKLLVPTGRQTTSCKPENLTAEAMRKKLARVQKDDKPIFQTKNSSETNEKAGRMALRTRKPMKVDAEPVKERDGKKTIIKSIQRNTFSPTAQVKITFT